MSRVALVYLGPYRLLNTVHTGYACQIWQAYDDRNQQMVGIKTLTDRFKKDRQQIGALRLEYKVGRAVIHPRILEMIALGTDRGAPYLAMEWFSAPNMKQRIQQGIDRIAHQLPQIIEQAAEALSFFNSRGWVHRDVKPDNFLVSDSGQVKLIDFALAVRNRGPLVKLMRLISPKKKVQGTRSYISPEQIRGEPVDNRADVYSFGCTIHELISGKPPFTGTTTQDLLNKHLKSTPPTLETADKNITPEFAQLVRRCLAKDPGTRPASMASFLTELRAIGVFKILPAGPNPALPGKPTGKTPTTSA